MVNFLQGATITSTGFSSIEDDDQTWLCVHPQSMAIFMINCVDCRILRTIMRRLPHMGWNHPLKCCCCCPFFDDQKLDRGDAHETRNLNEKYYFTDFFNYRCWSIIAADLARTREKVRNVCYSAISKPRLTCSLLVVVQLLEINSARAQVRSYSLTRYRTLRLVMERNLARTIIVRWANQLEKTLKNPTQKGPHPLYVLVATRKKPTA